MTKTFEQLLYVNSQLLEVGEVVAFQLAFASSSRLRDAAPSGSVIMSTHFGLGEASAP